MFSSVYKFNKEMRGVRIKDFADKKKILFLKIIIPVIIGAVLYFCFCPDVIFVGAIDDFLNTTLHITVSRTVFLPVIIRFYFFDFLWSYSFAGIICLLLDDGSPIPCITIPLGLGIIMEILQCMDIAAGTADVFDVVVEMIGIITAIIVTRRVRKNEETS